MVVAGRWTDWAPGEIGQEERCGGWGSVDPEKRNLDPEPSYLMHLGGAPGFNPRLENKVTKSLGSEARFPGLVPCFAVYLL